MVCKVCVIRTPPISLISCLTLSPSAQSHRLLFCSPNMQSLFSIRRCFVKGFPKSLVWLTSFHHLCLRSKVTSLGTSSLTVPSDRGFLHPSRILFHIVLFYFILSTEILLFVYEIILKRPLFTLHNYRNFVYLV